MELTTNIRNFYIRQNSTLPFLEYSLYENIQHKYGISKKMLTNIAVTFSMVDVSTGIYHIANSPADMIINSDRINDLTKSEYVLVYRFTEKQTAKVGDYYGEFCVDFLDVGNHIGKLKLPINSHINIKVTDSITKTTVI